MLKLFKVTRNFLISVSFLLLLITQCHAARVQYIIWGYVCNLDKPYSGMTVILSDVRAGKIVDTTISDRDGVYMFWLYEGGGNYNVSIDSKVMNYASSYGTASALGGTVTVKAGMASRLDLDLNANYMLENKTEQSVDYFCYITKTGNMYHALGCYYLNESCLARPYPYVLWKGYKPCSECLNME
jgi:hypothetical protein